MTAWQVSLICSFEGLGLPFVVLSEELSDRFEIRKEKGLIFVTVDYRLLICSPFWIEMATRTITQQGRGTGSGGRPQQTSAPSARSTSTTRASSSKSSVSNSSRPSRSQSSNRGRIKLRIDSRISYVTSLVIVTNTKLSFSNFTATGAIMKPPSSLNDSSCSSPTNPDQVKSKSRDKCVWVLFSRWQEKQA